MNFFKSIFRWLLPSSSANRAELKSGIRYAHPSHAPDGHKTMVVANSIKPKTIGGYENKSYITNLTNKDYLKSMTMACLQSCGAQGLNSAEVNERVLNGVLSGTGRTALEIETSSTRALLKRVRNELLSEGKIRFNSATRMWYSSARAVNKRKR